MKSADKLTFRVIGKCSTFGGPGDSGMGRNEGVALYAPASKDEWEIFLPGNGRLGHDLNPDAHYCAMRWVYKNTSVAAVRSAVVCVSSLKTGKSVVCHPADWGPNERTERIIDLSPGAARAIGVLTDEEVVVTGLWLPGT